MRTTALVAIAAFLIPLGSAQTVRADEPKGPPLADRAKILRAEMRRGPASDLAPYLAPDTDPALRKQAIRALGRIGDRAGGTEWLVKLLGGGADLIEVLQAAGLSGAAELESPVAGHLTSKDPQIQAEALLALGWIASASVGGYGSPQVRSDTAVRVAAKAAAMLHSTSVLVRAAALESLALAGQEGYLERVLALFRPDQAPEIRDPAAFAAWFLARARRTAAKALNPDWVGDLQAAESLSPWIAGGGRRLDALRPMGILAPTTLLPKSRLAALLRASVEDDPDPRVTQEFIARVLAARPSAIVDSWLGQQLEHADKKVRQAAVEALGQHGSPEAIAALKARFEQEPDERVLVSIGAALAQATKAAEPWVGNVLGRLKDQPGAFLDEAGLRIGLASKDPKTLDALADKSKTLHPLRQLLVLSALEEHKSEAVSRLVGECLGNADPYVRAAAVGLVGKQLLTDHLAILDQVLVDADTLDERDIRQAVVEAWAEFAKAGPTAEDRRAVLRTRILEVAHNDPAFTARASARKACKTLGIEGCPDEDPLQPNDWRGLPRPKSSVLGLDLTKGGPWLDEAEILQLADRMAADKPEFVVQNEVDGTTGMFRLAIDPSEAPVHAVSFLLAVTSGVYEGTLWHRVVPSFVIQGGDPHGDGSGDAGWSVPDEITRARFTRGALGMPKGEVRDTGGCQLFVMHSDYRPLDGRYTCYGRVVDGMDTVDKIRVGDRITSVRIVQSSQASPPRMGVK